MNNSQFRAIPKNDFFKIKFKLEKNPLLDWLNNLSQQDHHKACLDIVYLLSILNEQNISSKKRVLLLTVILEYLKEQHIRPLEATCWEVGFPLTVNERIYIEAVTWCYLLLSQGFFIASEDTGIKKEASFILVMALEASRKAQLHIAAIYSTPDDVFWEDIYKMFLAAERRKLFKFKVWEGKEITLEALFKNLFIFNACDTNQFRSREMQTIFYFLESVSFSVSIDKQANEEGLFSFDLEAQTPPKSFLKKESKNLNSIRYFSPLTAAHDIYNQLKEIETSKGALSFAHSSLFLSVIKTLSLGQKRRYTRITDGHEVSGIIGFNSIVNYLRKQTENKNKLSATKDLKLYLSKQLENNQSNSDKLILQQRDKFNQNIEVVTLKNIHIVDSSAKGYSVFWNGSDVKAKARVGDIFGIISEDEARLEIAMIRRIEMTVGNDFKFGAEIIGFKSEEVYIASPDDKNQATWAIFIPGIQELSEPDSLIFSIGSFKMGGSIDIYKGEEKIKGQLVKELNSTSGIILVELAYPDDLKKKTIKISPKQEKILS